MITTALLMAGMLGAAPTPQRAEASRGDKPREEFVISFTWQPVEKWQVEIRGYQFRRGTLPEIPPRSCQVKIIEAQYCPDLPSFFEKLKKQER
jgi:hypothetical protein